MVVKSTLLLLFIAALVSVTATKKVYNTAGERVNGKLNVHIVPHTHDDVGWLKTVDQYYYGANNSIQHAAVQYVLDSVFLALKANPDRKFIYVEQAFFQRWYRDQDSQTQTEVKALVVAGQLDFVNGGWCMHDEAGTHYIAMTDQTTLGHNFIKEEFGKVPNVGWQIDPFGHSATQAALLSAEVGFNALYFGRIDYQDRALRTKTKRTEMVWRGSKSLGSSAQVFTGAFLSGNYGPPAGFCFDQFCGDAPIMDDNKLEDNNVENRVDAFVAEALAMADSTVGNDIMMKMGSDFQHENSNEWYKNLDKLIHYVNLDGRINAFYSTPSIYTAAKATYNYTWPLKTDDFFPYADDADSMWSGYFTSRPALKAYVRESSGVLQAAFQVATASGANGSSFEALWEAMSVAQHHDAVSGTSKQHVANDYAKRIAKGRVQAEVAMRAALRQQVGPSLQGYSATLEGCDLLNVSVCSATQTLPSGGLAVVLYNPGSMPLSSAPVRLPVASNTLAVTDSDGKAVPSQLSATASSSTRGPGTNNPAPAAYSLLFSAAVPALGSSVYFVKPSSALPQREGVAAEEALETAPQSDTLVLQNDYLKVEFSVSGGGFSSITNLASGVSTSVTQEFLWYASYAQKGKQNSGAYIFRPNSTDSYPVSATPAKLTYVNGSVAQEVRMDVAPWLQATVRLFAGARTVEMEYKVGPIPFEDGVGKEVISRFSTSINSQADFFTDSNGREMLLRTRNYRPTWKINMTQPVAGNYFPVNAAISIADSSTQLTLLTDRSQGGASLASGQIEMMVHRRTLMDDGRGVGEPINETQSCTPYPNFQRVGTGLTIVGRHLLSLEPAATAADVWRPAARALFASPILSFAQKTGAGSALRRGSKPGMGAVDIAALPPSVSVVTMQPLPASGGNSFMLLRLGHEFGVGESAKYSVAAKVSLATLLAPTMKVVAATELSLTGNQDRSHMQGQQIQWEAEEDVAQEMEEAANSFPRSYGAVGSSLTVTIAPMEIKTFRVEYTN